MANLSKTDERCLKCEHYNDCDNKRMVACAMAESPPPEQYAEQASQSATMPVANDVIVKHDYRQIKIAPNTYVTIDLEEEKKKMRDKITEELYKGLNCNFLKNGG